MHASPCVVPATMQGCVHVNGGPVTNVVGRGDGTMASRPRASHSVTLWQLDSGNRLFKCRCLPLLLGGTAPT